MGVLRMHATGLSVQPEGCARPALTSPPLPGGSRLPSEERELPLWGLWGHDIVLFLFCFGGSISPSVLDLAVHMHTLFLSELNSVKVLGDTVFPAPDSPLFEHEGRETERGPLAHLNTAGPLKCEFGGSDPPPFPFFSLREEREKQNVLGGTLLLLCPGEGWAVSCCNCSERVFTPWFRVF